MKEWLWRYGVCCELGRYKSWEVVIPRYGKGLTERGESGGFNCLDSLQMGGRSEQGAQEATRKKP